MKLTINDVLGIRHAEVEIESGKVVEVVGPNASGKTSLAVCAQAVLARESNPLGMSAADAKRAYAHDGSDDARVQCDDGQCQATWYPTSGKIMWPEALTAEVWGAHATEWSRPEAVGLVDFTAKRGAKERAAVFQGALLPDPAALNEKVRESLVKYLPPDDLEGVLTMLSERGWEATEAVFAERARDAKRQWREITGKTYGVRVAADWRPDGWLADYDSMTVQQAEERVIACRDALNVLHQVQAISEVDAERAAQSAKNIPALQSNVEKYGTQLEAMQKEIAAIPLDASNVEVKRIEGKITELERSLNINRQTCPHCHGALTIVDGNIQIEDDQTRQDTEFNLAELGNAHYNALSNARNFADLSNNAHDHKIAPNLERAKQELRDAERSSKQTGTVVTEEHKAGLASAEQEVENAHEVVRMVKAEFDAAKLHETIARYAEVAKAVGPQGIRSKMIEDGLRKLNAGLRALAQESGWPLTEVAEGGPITCGGRPVAMCSESERWRVQASIQLTLAAITGSKAVVLDRADLLDASNRAGLVRAVHRVTGVVGLAVLLCSTGPTMANLQSPWPQISIMDGVTA